MQTIVPGVRMDGRETKVVDVIGATGFIQQDIPIGPACCAIVEIMDHRRAIVFTPLPLIKSLPAKWIITGLGQHKRLVRIRLSYSFDIVRDLRTMPFFIPMETKKEQE